MAYTTSPSCMHMAPVLQALISIGLLLASMSMLVPGGSAEEAPSGIELIHVDADGGFTREELIDRGVNRTHLRVEMLSATLGDGTDASATAGTDSVAAVHSHHEYLVKLEIGTPPMAFKAVPDTGSDLVWTKHYVDQCVRRGSSTFTLVDCDQDASVKKKMCTCLGGLCRFRRTFGHATKKVEGFMGNETLTLSRRKNTDTGTNEIINNYKVSIGCAISVDEPLLPKSADGIVGLNRGPTSLVQQLNLISFSYCLSDQRQPELSSRLWLGDGYSLDQLRAQGKKLDTTPLVDVDDIESHSSVWPNMYYVQLEGFSIGGNSTYKTLPQDRFSLKSKKDNSKGVMFVDSGCSRTLLENGVFGALVEQLAAELKANPTPEKTKNNLETACFQQPDAAATTKQPEMVLYFADGASMSLPWDNYMNKSGSSYCLAIYNTTTSILGNFQQQNTYMLYNLTQGHETLSFVQDFDCQKP